MNLSSNRLATSLFLLAMFGIIAYAGSRSSKAQTTQNVLVTNTTSQQVPVLPAARPGPGGAYVVTVANAPTVKVGGSIDYSDAFEVALFCPIASGSFVGTQGAYTVPAGKRFIVTHVSSVSTTSTSGSLPTLLAVFDATGGAYFYPTVSSSGFNAGANSDLFLVAEAGQAVTATASRSVTTGNTTCNVLLSGHLVNFP